MPKNTLEWGRTPWDDLPREQLLREVQRYYAALQAMNGCMRTIFEASDQSNNFWRSGTGGRALAMTDAILAPLYQDTDRENIYRSFFRYATGLLFPEQEPYHWVVCGRCGMMIGGDKGEIARWVGSPCKMMTLPECNGTMRWLTWDDLKPEASNENCRV